MNTDEKRNEVGYIFLVIYLFFIVMYTILETGKYEKVAIRARLATSSRPYKKEVVYCKLVVICIIFIMTIMGFTLPLGIMYKSSNIRNVIITLCLVLVYIGISVIDLKKLRSGHNEKWVARYGNMNKKKE